jgi:hypothetical protein
VQRLDKVDAHLTIFEPGFNPDKIGENLVRWRAKLFKHGEPGRLIIDALRRT